MYCPIFLIQTSRTRETKFIKIGNWNGYQLADVCYLATLLFSRTSSCGYIDKCRKSSVSCKNVYLVKSLFADFELFPLKWIATFVKSKVNTYALLV